MSKSPSVPKASLSLTQEDTSNEALLIHDIARQQRQCFDRRAQKIGLTRPQWLVLSTLRRNAGICQAALAELIEVKPISLGRMVDRLEAAGWVERRPHPVDRRARQLYLTNKVQAVIASMRQLAVELRVDMLKDFTQQEHDALFSMLQRIKNNLANLN